MRCPVPFAAAGAEEEPPSERKRTFEFCELTEDGEIEECAVVAEEDLPALLGFEEAARVLNDPMSSELFFGRTENASEDGDAEEKFTLAEWPVDGRSRALASFEFFQPLCSSGAGCLE